jgi:hypothetical protein
MKYVAEGEKASIQESPFSDPQWSR